MKGLGLAAGTRHPMLPDIPTAAESGVPGFELEAWTAIYAPAGTPLPIIDKLAAAMERVVKSEEFQKRAPGAGDLRRPHGPEGAWRLHRVPDHLLGRGDQEGQHLARLIGCCASGRVTSRGGVRWRRSTWRRS